MKPHIVKTCWGWAVYRDRVTSKAGLPIVVGNSVNGAITKYVMWEYWW